MVPDLIWTPEFLFPEKFGPQEIWSPRTLGPTKVGSCMKMLCNDFHAGPKFLAGPKLLGDQKIRKKLICNMI